MEKETIVIIGGGITGLSAAYYLQKSIQEKNLPYEIKLIEASNRLGGKIDTLKRDGFIIERGPDSIIVRKKPGVKLVEELGLKDKMIRNGTGQSYILVNGELHKMPKGAFMGIPKDIEGFLESELVSPEGKKRALLDLEMGKGEEEADQSLGAFLRRRLGDELVENEIEPLLAGIYSGDIDEMSLMATFPNFYHLVQKYGSLIKGLQETIPTPPKPTGKKVPGVFFSFKEGLGIVVDKLVEKLNEESITMEKAVTHIEKIDSGYQLSLSDGEIVTASAVIATTPHQTIPKMFNDIEFLNVLTDVPSSSVANVALAFDQSAIKQDIDGTGFVVSRNNDYRITACTWTHKKWPTTTPEGKALIRCYVGRPNDQEVVDLPDEELINIVLHDLNKTMNITAKPEFSVISRWKNVMPQYTVGHLERIEKVRDEANKHLPGVFLAGSSFEGVGIPDCIEQGEKAVEQVLEFLQLSR
ncbi:protoporphyrinogen oxidase [Ornithinibacillus halotolerans]|uniref:Coproporphyrinogen III oxidase n=1 Tax=Ornithinibacillus halotolerans TaxID=1274357 RepID=A0A916W6Z1_9BACI|nr:protoporphyrinogen oxidase [Ornithinibacillus halotolerans]GGA73657.1 protoporphyrinogen oxidase [Ornithinibacillus halotolerans]